MPLTIRCHGSTTAHPVNPALLSPKAARDSSVHGGHPAVATRTPGGPLALGIARREGSGRQKAATTTRERYNSRSIVGSAALRKELACLAMLDVVDDQSLRGGTGYEMVSLSG